MNNYHLSQAGAHARALFASLVALCLAATTSSHGQITDLASFNGSNGANPDASLILIGSTLYGTTNQGGA